MTLCVKVELRGERLGDLVPVNQRYVFFTTHQRLKALDGKDFNSSDELHRAINSALRSPTKKAA